MRTIIVGDVHGCATELDALLRRVGFGNGDRLVFVGDLVARGPSSLGVLDIVRQTGAIVVRGNHEQRLLDWRDARERKAARDDAPKHSIGRMHRELARALRPVDWILLETSRLHLDLPEHGLRVVHAGVDPGVPFERQKPNTLLSVRTAFASEGKRGQRSVLWGALYDGPPHVVFGHNAIAGLQLHPWATGLDTGCVYGRSLTALVLDEGRRVPREVEARKALLVSEPARRVWYVPSELRAKRGAA